MVFRLHDVEDHITAETIAEHRSIAAVPWELDDKIKLNRRMNATLGPHNTRHQIVDSVNRCTVRVAMSRARVKVAFSHSPRMSTGTSMLLTSALPACSYSR